KRVLQSLLNRTFERSGTIHGIESSFCKQRQRVFTHFKPYVLLSQTSIEILELDGCDTGNLFRCQLVKDDDLINSVDEFRPEMTSHDFEYGFLGGGILLVRGDARPTHGLDDVGAEVR